MIGSTIFADTLQRAIKRGLVGAAVIDCDGNVIERAGTTADDVRSSLADLVTHLKSDDALGIRLHAGELVVLSLGYDELVVAVVRAGQELIVVSVLTDSTSATLDSVWALRDRILRLLRNPGTPGGGPAELQVVELGVTVPRKAAKN